MKSTVFARPNLKALLFGAILIAVVQNFIANGSSDATFVHARGQSGAGPGSEENLEQLLAQADNTPTSQLFGRISRCYQKRGDLKKALLYVRKAQVLGQIEEATE